MISFTIGIAPEVVSHGNRIGKNRQGNAVIYSTSKKNVYQLCVEVASKRYRPSTPFTGPVKLNLVFILPRPKSLMRKSDPDGWIWAPKRPDRDNLIKGTQDGLSGAGFWLDDAQICDGRAAKYYTEKGGSPRIIVEIEELL